MANPATQRSPLTSGIGRTGLAEGIFLAGLGPDPPEERHAQQRIALLLQLRLHPHRIGLPTLPSLITAAQVVQTEQQELGSVTPAAGGVEHGLIRPAGEAVGGALELGADVMVAAAAAVSDIAGSLLCGFSQVACWWPAPGRRVGRGIPADPSAGAVSTKSKLIEQRSASGSAFGSTLCSIRGSTSRPGFGARSQ